MKKTIDSILKRLKLVREADYQKLVWQGHRTTAQLADLQREYGVLQSRLDPIVREIAKVRVMVPKDRFEHFRLVTEISAHYMDAFMHGNDKAIIDVIGHKIGREVASALYNRNLWRRER